MSSNISNQTINVDITGSMMEQYARNQQEIDATEQRMRELVNIYQQNMLPPREQQMVQRQMAEVKDRLLQLGVTEINLDGHTPPTFSYEKLSPRQEVIKRRLRSAAGRKQLEAMPVLLVADPEGKSLRNKYKGVVVGLPTGRSAWQGLFKVHLQNDKLLDVVIYQIEPLIEIELTPAERRKKALDEMVGKVASRVSQSSKNVSKQILMKQSEAKSLRERAEAADKDATKYQQIYSALGNGQYTLAELEKQLEMIRKLEQVEDAYLSVNGRIIVITKMLEAFNPEIDEYRGKELGRFIIRIPLGGGDSSEVLACNRDYMDGELSHPNIDEFHFCWGNVQDEVNRMLDYGQYFLLTELIINFISTYPQDSGANPYTDYGEWLDDREDSGTDELLEERI